MNEKTQNVVNVIRKNNQDEIILEIKNPNKVILEIQPPIGYPKKYGGEENTDLRSARTMKFSKQELLIIYRVLEEIIDAETWIGVAIEDVENICLRFKAAICLEELKTERKNHE